MGKKKKKATPHSNIKKVTCIDCPRSASLIVTQEECKACEHHKDGYCKYVLPVQLISVVSQGTPMKFNRELFQSSSNEIADTTRNYYLFTDIMQGVRNILGYPKYSAVKKRFLAGEFKRPPVKKESVLVNVKDPVLYLIESIQGTPDMIVEGKQYQVTHDRFSIEGEWEVLYYLYDMLSLDGFSDIKVQDRWYKVRLSPIEASSESYVVARQNKNLVIGRIKNEKSTITNNSSVSAPL